ncbi:Histone deacetylase 6 [Nymphaea thermarum]|nr:Histone deacetylase 6 [Nymphaea thermarum]
MSGRVCAGVGHRAGGIPPAAVKIETGWIPPPLQFAPDFTIISAGFDAAQGDPLGGCSVTPTGFAQMTHMLMGLSKGKLLLVLEGGYNLRSISSSSTAVVKVLLGEKPAVKMGNILPSKSGLQTLLEVLDIQLKFWSNLEPCYAKGCLKRSHLDFFGGTVVAEGLFMLYSLVDKVEKQRCTGG